MKRVFEKNKAKFVNAGPWNILKEALEETALEGPPAPAAEHLE